MSGLLQIFFSPGKVFDQVRERKMFLPGMLGVIFLAAVSFTMLINLVGMETLARKQFENSPRMAAQMTPQQMETAIQASNTPLRKNIGYAAVIISTAVGLMALSGLALGGLTLMGAKVTYPQVLGATSYGWFPFAFLNLFMTTIILLVTPDRDSLNFQNLIATNIGAYLNKETTGKALLSVANSIDLISFAQIAFISYGYAKVSGLPFSKCASILIGIWLIYVIGKAGIAAI